MPTNLPVFSGLVKHTADALTFIKVYFPRHLALVATSVELPIIEILYHNALVLIFQSFESSRPTIFKYFYKKIDIYFSNSRIIHHVNTDEITTVQEVWIPLLNYKDFDDFTSPFTP